MSIGKFLKGCLVYWLLGGGSGCGLNVLARMLGVLERLSRTHSPHHKTRVKLLIFNSKVLFTPLPPMEPTLLPQQRMESKGTKISLYK